jgi:pseudouridine-5'-phosphate glycosidase/pseudouridine kinase
MFARSRVRSVPTVIRICRSHSVPNIKGVIVSDVVQEALRNGQPVVALESTIISHGGIPYPQNLEVGRRLEQTVRDAGGVPATCAVVDGVPRVGLNDEQLRAIAKSHVESPVLKASCRDLGHAISSKSNASTTVSGTMILAHLAGIRVFATGGIGGVHRAADGSPSIDISADLTELGRTPVTVVCAGVKSILHIPATLEVLETLGVPVMAYRTNIFPAFFTADSGVLAPLVANSASHVASTMLANESLGLQQGLVLAVPTPEPMADATLLKACIDEALKSAAKEGITGAKITPYLLAAVTRLTGGKSLEANIHLVINNVRIATEIALQYASMVRARNSNHITSLQQGGSSHQVINEKVVVFGGAAIDNISTVGLHPPIMNSSNPGETVTYHGGVGRNLAEKLALKCGNVAFITAIGNDDAGQQLLHRLKSLGVNTDSINVVSNANTARYTAIHSNDGELIVSVADMEIFKRFTVENVRSRSVDIKNAKLVIVDSNFSSAAINEIATLSRKFNVPVLLEPTSDYKASLVVSSVPFVDVIKPNITELICLLKGLRLSGNTKIDFPLCFESILTKMQDLTSYDGARNISISDVSDLSTVLWKYMQPENSTTHLGKHVLTSLGSRGVIWVSSEGVHHVPAIDIKKKNINSNGAGDALMASIAASILSNNFLNLQYVEAAVKDAADHILRSSKV